jgi:hypothetical protein
MMPFILIILAFTLQAIFRSMSRMLTPMLTSSPRFANLFCFCKCLPLLCHTLVLSFLLLKISFGLSLISFSGCLKLVSCAFVCFIGSLKPFMTRSNEVFCLPLHQIPRNSMDKSTWFLFILSCWCLHYIQRGHSS